MDSRVNNIIVTQTSRISLTGQVTPIIDVKFWVGTNGPFDEYFTQAEYTPDNVEAKIMAHVATLEKLGAIAPAQPGA